MPQIKIKRTRKGTTLQAKSKRARLIKTTIKETTRADIIRSMASNKKRKTKKYIEELDGF